MRLLLALAMASCAFGALTTVTDTIKDASGVNATGIIRITPVQRFTSQGVQVYGQTVNVSITRGVFTVNLSPTDVSVPTNIYYIVRYSINGNPGTSPTEFWFVPTSASPVGLNTVRGTPGQNPTVMYALSQLLCPSTCFAGQSIVYSGTSWTNGVAGVVCTLTATTSTTCTHNLNSVNVGVDVFDNSGNETRGYRRITVTGVNTVLITFDSAFTGTAVIK